MLTARFEITNSSCLAAIKVPWLYKTRLWKEKQSLLNNCKQQSLWWGTSSKVEFLLTNFNFLLPDIYTKIFFFTWKIIQIIMKTIACISYSRIPMCVFGLHDLHDLNFRFLYFVAFFIFFVPSMLQPFCLSFLYPLVQ